MISSVLITRRGFWADLAAMIIDSDMGGKGLTGFGFAFALPAVVGLVFFFTLALGGDSSRDRGK